MPTVCVLWMLPKEALSISLGEEDWGLRGVWKHPASQFISQFLSLQIVRFFSALPSPFSFLKIQAQFRRTFTSHHQYQLPQTSWGVSFPISHCPLARGLLWLISVTLLWCSPLQVPRTRGGPVLFCSCPHPTQPSCVSFKQGQMLLGWRWFRDSHIDLSRASLSGWSGPFFAVVIMNNLNLFSTSQILSLSSSSLLSPNWIWYSSHPLFTLDLFNRKKSRSYTKRLIICSFFLNSLQLNHFFFKVWGTNCTIF